MTECYMCSTEANSIEHVPPKCIFPESKDFPKGVNYRKSLITVPSCKEHNSNKSGDDEYLLFLLTTNWSVNDIGLQQWKTKVLRSIRKNPAKKGIFRELKPLMINGVQTGYYKINFDRISQEIDRISRGIYYYHLNQKWPHPIGILFPSAISTHASEGKHHNEVVQLTSAMTKQFLGNEPILGENPDIFYYQFKVDQYTPYYCLRMVFYGGIEISTISPDTEPTQAKSLYNTFI